MPESLPERSPAKPPKRARGVVVWRVASFLVVALAASLVFVWADRSSRIVSVLAVAALFALPLALGVGVERAATRLRRTVRAERVALELTPVLALAVLVLACTSLRTTTGSALLDVPARYAWTRGPLGDSLRRLGELLGGSEARGDESAARPPLEPPASAPTSSGAPPAPSADASPGPARFASGDPSYREPGTCETLGDVSALEREHSPGKLRASAEGLASARYPAGVPFLKVQSDTELHAWFAGAPDSFEGVASRIDSAIHEGAHIWGVRRFSLATQTYPVRVGVEVVAKRLKSFPRSEILSRHVDPESDTYAKTYLSGASGAQGFNSLLDEYNAYAHTLAARYCTRDLLPENQRVSARDGILTFMYYVETYLEIARTRHPETHQAILADPGLRKVVVEVWDRAEHWLRLSADEPALGLNDDKIRGWVYEPERLAEIGRVRQVAKAP